MPKRLTKQTRRLLEALVAAPADYQYGFELMELADLSSGTVYPLLHRLQQEGWLTCSQEDLDPAEAGRPRRRLYRLTGTGESAARAALASERAPATTPQPKPLMRPRGAIT